MSEYVFVYSHPDRTTVQIPTPATAPQRERFWRNFTVRTTKEFVFFAIKFFTGS